MSYFSSKGEKDPKEMPFPHLQNARNMLARKLAAGEETGQNTEATLAELDAEIVRRNALFEEQRAAEEQNPTTTTGEGVTLLPDDGPF